MGIEWQQYVADAEKPPMMGTILGNLDVDFEPFFKSSLTIQNSIKVPILKHNSFSAIDIAEPHHKSTLILDLDNTMVHAVMQRFPQGDSKFWPHMNQTVDENLMSEVFDIRIRPGYDPCIAKLRPGLRDFMLKLSSIFDIGVFTLGQYEYAEAILHIIDPEETLIADRFRARTAVPQGDGQDKHLKQLNLITGRHANRLIVLDDRRDVIPHEFKDSIVQAVFYNFLDSNPPLNSVPRVPCFLEDSDRYLYCVMRFLRDVQRRVHYLSTLPFRPYESGLWGVDEAMNEVRRELLLGVRIGIDEVLVESALELHEEVLNTQRHRTGGTKKKGNLSDEAVEMKSAKEEKKDNQLDAPVGACMSIRHLNDEYHTANTFAEALFEFDDWNESIQSWKVQPDYKKGTSGVDSSYPFFSAHADHGVKNKAALESAFFDYGMDAVLFDFPSADRTECTFNQSGDSKADDESSSESELDPSHAIRGDEFEEDEVENDNAGFEEQPQKFEVANGSEQLSTQQQDSALFDLQVEDFSTSTKCVKLSSAEKSYLQKILPLIIMGAKIVPGHHSQTRFEHANYTSELPEDLCPKEHSFISSCLGKLSSADLVPSFPKLPGFQPIVSSPNPSMTKEDIVYQNVQNTRKNLMSIPVVTFPFVDAMLAQFSVPSPALFTSKNVNLLVEREQNKLLPWQVTNRLSSSSLIKNSSNSLLQESFVALPFVASKSRWPAADSYRNLAPLLPPTEPLGLSLAEGWMSARSLRESSRRGAMGSVDGDRVFLCRGKRSEGHHRISSVHGNTRVISEKYKSGNKGQKQNQHSAS